MRRSVESAGFGLKKMSTGISFAPNYTTTKQNMDTIRLFAELAYQSLGSGNVYEVQTNLEALLRHLDEMEEKQEIKPKLLVETANEADDAKCQFCGAFLREDANGLPFCPLHEYFYREEDEDNGKDN